MVLSARMRLVQICSACLNGKGRMSQPGTPLRLERFIRLFMGMGLFMLLWPSSPSAQWSTDPSDNLIIGYGGSPQICSDSAGGAYVTFENGTPQMIALQRVNSQGYLPWAGPRTLQGILMETSYAYLAADGHNGVIVAFEDIQRLGGFPPRYIIRVRAQRVDTAGNLLWGPAGVRVSVAEQNQGADGIAKDGHGGCFAAFGDSTGRMWLQRLDSNGDRMWGDSGIVVGDAYSPYFYMMSDGQDGCILLLSGIAQRLNAVGQKMWGDSGVATTGMGILNVASDGMCGVVIAGMKRVSYNGGDSYFAAKCQRVDSSGQIRWGSDGLVLADSLQSIVDNPPGITAGTNRGGGATFAWQKRVRPGILRSFTQRILPEGTPVFPVGGIRVSTYDSSANGTWSITTSNDESKIYMLVDGRYSGSTFAQKIDSAGSRRWDSTDVLISSHQLGDYKSVSDGAGGVVIVGIDQTDYCIRAQQCSRNGHLGEVLTSVGDHPEVNSLPLGFVLYQNFPNPFNPATSIRYELQNGDKAKIDVLDLLGRQIRVLVDGYQSKGRHEVVLVADGLASGMYFYRLSTSKGTQVRKLLILK